MIRSKGFSLIELMIAVAVIGILAAVAYPSYQDHVTKTRRADAQGALMSFANAMERFYTENGTYAGAAAGGNNTGAPAIFNTQAPLDGSTKYYNLRIASASGSAFTLRATPISNGAQDGDGILELDGTGARRWDKNNDGDTGDSGENCWEQSC